MNLVFPPENRDLFARITESGALITQFPFNRNGDRQSFANRRNDDVHGCGSWGPQKETNIWWRLDFGRPVEIDKVILFLRAAWTPENEPHDSWWREATVEFSDGSTEKLELKQVATGQEFSFARRTVNWL